MFDADVLLRQLSELGLRLDAEVEKLGELDVLATGLGCRYQALREHYEDEVANAFLKSDGSVEQKKMLARLKTIDARLTAQDAALAWENAKADLRTQQAAVRALHTRIDVGRSLLSTEKARLELDRLPEPR